MRTMRRAVHTRHPRGAAPCAGAGLPGQSLATLTRANTQSTRGRGMRRRPRQPLGTHGGPGRTNTSAAKGLAAVAGGATLLSALREMGLTEAAPGGD